MTKEQGPMLKQPAACSNHELTEFERLVRLGGEVTAVGLRDRIQAAEQLAFIPGQASKFIAVAALKRPAPTYRSTVFAKAHSSENPSDFTLELGWVYVEQEHRGKGFANALVETLVNYCRWKPRIRYIAIKQPPDAFGAQEVWIHPDRLCLRVRRGQSRTFPFRTLGVEDGLHRLPIGDQHLRLIATGTAGRSSKGRNGDGVLETILPPQHRPAACCAPRRH